MSLLISLSIKSTGGVSEINRTECPHFEAQEAIRQPASQRLRHPCL